jgi:hypothetical protein
MSLDGYGSFDGPDPSKDTGMSGAATSAAESGKNTSDTLAEGASYQDVQDYRNQFIAAGGGQRVNPGFFDSKNTVSPAELAAAKRFDPISFGKNRSSGIMGLISGGGIFGNLLRGLGRKLGFGKNYDEPTYDMSGINTRLYENIPGVSTNPNYLDIYNEFADDEGEDKEENFNYAYDINKIKELIESQKNEPLVGTEPTILSSYENYLLDAPPNPLSLEEFTTLQAARGGVNL